MLELNFIVCQQKIQMIKKLKMFKATGLPTLLYDSKTWAQWTSRCSGYRACTALSASHLRRSVREERMGHVTRMDPGCIIYSGNWYIHNDDGWKQGSIHLQCENCDRQTLSAWTWSDDIYCQHKGQSSANRIQSQAFMLERVKLLQAPTLCSYIRLLPAPLLTSESREQW